MHYRGRVGSACCVERELLGGPRGVVQLNPDAVVAQPLEVGAGRVRDVVDACGQVGLASNVVDKLSPGRRASKFLGKQSH